MVNDVMKDFPSAEYARQQTKEVDTHYTDLLKRLKENIEASYKRGIANTHIYAPTEGYRQEDIDAVCRELTNIGYKVNSRKHSDGNYIVWVEW